jgi:GH24 family phage-related lysozyme (muramidase)
VNAVRQQTVDALIDRLFNNGSGHVSSSRWLAAPNRPDYADAGDVTLLRGMIE